LHGNILGGSEMLVTMVNQAQCRLLVWTLYIHLTLNLFGY